jgi:hypothetical protein
MRVAIRNFKSSGVYFLLLVFSAVTLILLSHRVYSISHNYIHFLELNYRLKCEYYDHCVSFHFN